MIKFAHVGLHKTGTTWLQTTAFARHPQLNVVGAAGGVRELKVAFQVLAAAGDKPFDVLQWRKDFEAIARPVATGDRLFGASRENLSGHMITGAYAYTNAERLAAAFGDIKIFMVLRHPVSYVRSVYFQYVKHGGASPLHSFLSDHTIPGKALARRLDYGKLVTRYQELFGKANVLVLPYELLAKSPQRFLGYIWTFLDVDDLDMETVPSGRTNPAFSPLSLRAMRLANFLGMDRLAVRRRLQRLDRILPRKFAARGIKISSKYLREFTGGPVFEGFHELLRDQNYLIWTDELEEFNYKFDN